MTRSTHQHRFGLTIAILATMALVVTPAIAAERRPNRRQHGAATAHASKRDPGKSKKSQVRVGIRLGGNRGRVRRNPSVVIRSRFTYAAGYYQSRWIAPAYETRYDTCGRPYTVMIRAGCYRQVWIPGGWHTASTLCRCKRGPKHAQHRLPRRHESGVHISGHFDF